MPKPWPITSLRGHAGLSDDSEDLRGDSPEPVRDDTSAEDRAVEGETMFGREMRIICADPPDYFAEQVAIARKRVDDLYVSARGKKLRELSARIDEIERLHLESRR